MESSATYEFVRFDVGDSASSRERLQALTRAVDAFAAEKNETPSGQSEPGLEGLKQWEATLPEEALATFRTGATRAWLPPSGLIERGWDGLSMVAAVLGAETRLLGVFEKDGTGELRFEALAWPYGGISSLIRLVEAFGFDILAYEHGAGPVVSREEHQAIV